MPADDTALALAVEGSVSPFTPRAGKGDRLPTRIFARPMGTFTNNLTRVGWTFNE